MSTKYGGEISDRWRWRYQDDNPRVSDHVLFEREDKARWDRTPSDSCSPEYAYENGIDVSFMRKAFTDNGHQVPDEVVFWSEETDTSSYAVVFIVKDSTIRTVYRVDSIKDPVLRTALLALRELVEP